MVDDVVLVVLLVDDVDAAGVLVPAPMRLLVDDNHTRNPKFYDFLDGWVADHSGLSMTSGCFPKEKPNKEKSKRNKSKKGLPKKKPNMKKSKRNKNKKDGIIGKASVISLWMVPSFSGCQHDFGCLSRWCSRQEFHCVVQVVRVIVVVRSEGRLCGSWFVSVVRFRVVYVGFCPFFHKLTRQLFFLIN